MDTAEQYSFHGIPTKNTAARSVAVTGIGNRNANMHGDDTTKYGINKS